MASYDPAKVNIIVGGFPVTGLADGTMIEVDFVNDNSSLHIGTQGEGRHIDSKDRSAIATIRLADYSASNDSFQTLFELGVPFPILVQDKTTKAALAFAESCKVRKVPVWGRGDVTTINEWPFQAVRASIVHSGDKDN